MLAAVPVALNSWISTVALAASAVRAWFASDLVLAAVGITVTLLAPHTALGGALGIICAYLASSFWLLPTALRRMAVVGAATA